MKSANEEEDKNIKRLEKLLKINKTKKGKKIPKMFDDGLDYMLELCDSENVEKLYAAAKSGNTDNVIDENWELDLNIATGKDDEESTGKKQSKKKQASIDADSDFDLSDEDSEFGDEDEDDGLDQDQDMLDEDSDDDAPEERPAKTSKRNGHKAPVAASAIESSESSAEDEDELGSDIHSGDDFNDGDNSDDNASNDENDSDALDKNDEPKAKPDVWEDIYGRKRDKAGNVIDDKEAPQKYVPPHLKARMAAEASGVKAANGMDNDPVRQEKLLRLKKLLKGYLNRLSEANMHKIATDIENLYMQHSRHDMNETLTTLLCDALISNVLSKERLVLEHTLLLAALHANIGSEIGAHVLQALINKVDTFLRQDVESAPVEDKTLDNTLLILCHLYTFKVSSKYCMKITIYI